MDLERTAADITERKMVRRGLLAGVVALTVGALSKLTTRPAQALDPQDIDMNTVNTSASLTTLNSAAAGGAAYTVLQIQNFRAGGDGLRAIGGPGVIGGGHGVVATGGAAVAGAGGPANGGSGLRGTGGDSSTGAAGGGVVGIGGMGLSMDGIGVQGNGGGSSGVGVWGVGGGSVGTQGIGVRGETYSDVNAAVRGFNFRAGAGVSGESGSGIGVLGTTASTFAGVQGTNTGAGPAVRGASVNGPGVHGESTNSLGVRGVSTNFVAVVGISTNSHGLYGSTNVGVNGYGIVAENLGPNGPALLVNGTAPSQVFGGLQVFGPKNAVLKMQDGSFASVYCQESPEPYFEDFGRAQLVGGVANVPLEREFAALVAGSDYHVFTEPEGETRGLFVSRRTPGGFEVREIGGGSGSAPFSYRIVTRRKDIEGKRFARVSTEAAEKVAGVRAVLASMGAAGPTSGPSSPLPPQQAVPPSFTNTPPVIPGGNGYTNLPPGVGPSSVNPNPGR